MVNGIVGKDCHPIIFFNPQIAETICHPVARSLKFGICQGFIPKDQGRFVRIMIGGAPDHVCDHQSVYPETKSQERGVY